MDKPLIYKVGVYAPFRQRRYIELMRDKINELRNEVGAHQLNAIALIEKLDHMCDTLIKDDHVTMGKELPEKYYEIIGRVGCIGKATDPDDVWEEEPHCAVREISREEFERDD